MVTHLSPRVVERIGTFEQFRDIQRSLAPGAANAEEARCGAYPLTVWPCAPIGGYMNASPTSDGADRRVPDASRRRVVSTFAATSVGAWVAPSVLSLDSVAAAVGSSPAPTPTVTGDATIGTLMAGQSLRPDGVTWSSNSQFYVFTEQVVTLTSPQTTDSGMTLPTGVQLVSFLIHYSPASGVATLNGSVVLPGSIVGYDWKDPTLAAQDATWGVPGVNYGVGRRAMEWPGNDTITFTLPGSVSLSMYASASFVDQIRIYVVC